MVNGNASVGDVFDSAAGLVFDGATGYGAGKAAIKFGDTGRNVQLYRVAGQEEVNNSVKAGKLVKHQATQGEYWMSETTKHSRPYYKSRKYPNKSTLKAKVPCKVYGEIRKNMIEQIRKAPKLNKQQELRQERDRLIYTTGKGCTIILKGK